MQKTTRMAESSPRLACPSQARTRREPRRKGYSATALAVNGTLEPVARRLSIPSQDNQFIKPLPRFLWAVCKTLHGDNRLIDTSLHVYYGRPIRAQEQRAQLHPPSKNAAGQAAKTESIR